MRPELIKTLIEKGFLPKCPTTQEVNHISGLIKKVQKGPKTEHHYLTNVTSKSRIFEGIGAYVTGVSEESMVFHSLEESKEFRYFTPSDNQDGCQFEGQALTPHFFPCISIKDVYNWLILEGIKDVEVRGKRIKEKWAYIHCPETKTIQSEMEPYQINYGAPKTTDYKRGFITGLVYFGDALEESSSIWFNPSKSYNKSYAWPIKYVHEFKKPIPCKGSRGWFYPNPALLEFHELKLKLKLKRCKT